MLQRRALLSMVATAAIGGRTLPTMAGTLPPPAGEVLLTVTGAISATNDAGAARLDRAQLLAWGPGQLRTTTPWTEGAATFEGVFGDRLLAELGVIGTLLRCTALNDYSVDIPVQELREFPVLFALQQDGEALKPRGRGPIWVVYPWSQHPDLDDRLHRQRAIWQLTAIAVA